MDNQELITPIYELLSHLARCTYKVLHTLYTYLYLVNIYIV